MQALDGLFKEDMKHEKQKRLEERKKRLSEMLLKETKEFEVVTSAKQIVMLEISPQSNCEGIISTCSINLEFLSLLNFPHAAHILDRLRKLETCGNFHGCNWSMPLIAQVLNREDCMASKEIVFTALHSIEQIPVLTNHIPVLTNHIHGNLQTRFNFLNR